MFKYILASILLFAVPTLAQQADVPLRQTAGVYTVKVQAPSDADMAQICIERVDVSPSQELGCAPAGPDEIVLIDVTVTRTENDDAELRAFAYDTDGNKSESSPNAGTVDFTNPGAPTFLP